MYTGPRFYRVTYTHRDKPGTITFHGNRAGALSEARRLAANPRFEGVAVETIDDRHPANVLESEPVTR